ncbi:hypothetical protein L0Y49_05170 [bacterium]|nr:hypothetical protein [bacterium]
MNRKHFKCLLWKGLWIVSIFFLAAAWASLNSDSEWLLWNALIFAVLSVPIKLDCHSCEVCQIPTRR